MKFDSHTIYKPHSQPRLQRGLFGLVTFAFWIVYAYLWLPLATLVLWLLGVRTAAFELYLREHQIDPFLLVSLPLLALVSGVLLIAWAEYNRYRFGDRERRGGHPDVAAIDVARAIGCDPQIALRLSGSKITDLRMDDTARPAGMVERAAPREAWCV